MTANMSRGVGVAVSIAKKHVISTSRQGKDATDNLTSMSREASIFFSQRVVHCVIMVSTLHESVEMGLSTCTYMCSIKCSWKLSCFSCTVGRGSAYSMQNIAGLNPVMRQLIFSLEKKEVSGIVGLFCLISLTD